jgi:hypothetical protein
VQAGPLRGGVVGADAVWVRGEEPERSSRAAGFTGASPAFAVATARLLSLGLLDRRRIPLVDVATGLVVDQGWALVDVADHETETGPLRVERYEVADLATAERSVVHIAGDVVLDAPGIELYDLESPPNQGASR